MPSAQIFKFMNIHLPANPSIGWIGTGVMGRSMFGHILDKGYKGFVYTRTKEKAATLIEKGASWCNSTGEVASKADIVFTMVGFPADVRDVFLSKGRSDRFCKARYHSCGHDNYQSEPCDGNL